MTINLITIEVEESLIPEGTIRLEDEDYSLLQWYWNDDYFMKNNLVIEIKDEQGRILDNYIPPEVHGAIEGMRKRGFKIHLNALFCG